MKRGARNQRGAPRRGGNAAPINTRADLIALGSSTNSAPTTARSPSSKSAQTAPRQNANTKQERQIEKKHNKEEELVGMVLTIWYDSEDKQTRDTAITEKLNEALNFMYMNPSEPDRYYFACLCYLSKLIPELFASTDVVEHYTKMLKADPRLDESIGGGGGNMEQHPFRKNPAIPLLCCNVLYEAHKNKEDDWPLQFLQCYMEDAFNSRIWVDNENAKLFIINILTALPKSYAAAGAIQFSSANAAAIHSALIASGLQIQPTVFEEGSVKNRWSLSIHERVEKFIVEMIDYYQDKKQENHKSFIKTLCTTASVPGSRFLGSRYVEEWLKNSSLVRFGKDYLQRLITETHRDDDKDKKILASIITLKVKMAHLQLLIDSVSKILGNNPNYPIIGLKMVIESELLSRSLQVNTKLLTTVFKAVSSKLESHLAGYFKEWGFSDEYKGQLIQLLKKLIKSPNKEMSSIDLIEFSLSLCQSSAIVDEIISNNYNSLIIDQWLLLITDLICLSILLSIPSSSTVITQTSSLPQLSSVVPLESTREFHSKLKIIQNNAIYWCHDCVVNKIKSHTKNLQNLIIKKLLFLEPVENYAVLSDPGEKINYHFVNTEVPIDETTIFRLILISLDENSSLCKDECLDILCKLIYRAIPLHLKYNQFQSTFDVIKITNSASIVPAILSFTRIAHISQINPKQFVHSDLYWKACLLLVTLAAFNPTTVGLYIWENVKPVKEMMEMCVTQNFKYPPVTSQMKYPDYEKEVQKFKEQEKIEVSKFEKELEGKNFNKMRIILDPTTELFTEAPSYIIEQLQQLNKEFQLGKVLCGSRDPDFLVDIMKRQGTKHAMNWLIGIVKADPLTLSNLPVCTLCNLLLSYMDQYNNSPNDFDHFVELSLLLQQFNKYLTDPKDANPTADIIKFIFEYSTSRILNERNNAKKACVLLFNSITLQENCSPTEPRNTPDNPSNSKTNTSLDHGNLQNKQNRKISGAPNKTKSLDKNKKHTMPTQNHSQASAPVPAPQHSQVSLKIQQEIQQLMKEKINFKWIEIIRNLKHFSAIENLLFEFILSAIQVEDEKEAFLNYFKLLKDIYFVQSERYRSRIVVSLCKVICFRKLISETLFFSFEIYKSSFICLFEFFQEKINQVGTEADTENQDEIMEEQELPKNEEYVEEIVATSEASGQVLQEDEELITIQIPSVNQPFTINKLIILGAIQLISYLNLNKNHLTQLENDENFKNPFQTMLSLLFSNQQTPLCKNKKNDNFETIITESIAKEYSRSTIPVLYNIGINYFSPKYLFNLLTDFGLPLESVRLIFNKLASLSFDELKNELHSFNIFVQQSIYQRILLYVDLNITEALPFLYNLFKENHTTSLELSSNYKIFVSNSEKSLQQGNQNEIKPLILIGQKIDKDNMQDVNEANKMEDIDDQNDKIIDKIINKLENEIKNKELKEVNSWIDHLIEFVTTSKQINSDKIILVFQKIVEVLKNNLQHEKSIKHQNKLVKLNYTLKIIVNKLKLSQIDQMSDEKMNNNNLEEFLHEIQKNLFDFFQNNQIKNQVIKKQFRDMRKNAKKMEKEENIDGKISKIICLISEDEQLLEKYSKIEKTLKEILENDKENQIKNLLAIIERTQERNAGKLKYFGLFYDKIEEALGINKINENQFLELFKFLFLQKPNITENSKDYFKYFLISIFIHENNWENLRKCLQWIISIEKMSKNRINPSEIIEFLQIYLFHPKSWIGYTGFTNESTGGIGELGKKKATLYKFTTSDIQFLIDLIIFEQNLKNKFDKNLIKFRMEFLLSLIFQYPENISTILLYLSNIQFLFITKNKINSVDGEMGKGLKNQMKSIEYIKNILFLNFPNQIKLTNLLENSELLTPAEEEENFTNSPINAENKISSNRLNLSIHRLLKSLLDFKYSEIAFKILSNTAIHYKEYFLNYLPTMLALLEGKSHLLPTIFIERDFYRLFIHCLAIFDLLRPDIFFHPIFPSILNCYFQLIENWSFHYHESIIPLIDKFINFLCHFAIDHVTELISKKKILQNLQKTYPSVTKIQSLLEIISSFLSSKNIHDKISTSLLQLPFDSNNIQQVKKSILSWKIQFSSFDNQQIYLNRFYTGNISLINIHTPSNEFTDLNNDRDAALISSINTLKELDLASQQVPVVLKYFISELLLLIHSPSPHLRGISHILLLRYLHFNPSASLLIVPDYLNSFSEFSIAVQADALQHAPEYFYFASDNTGLFLRKLFDIGPAAVPMFQQILHNTTLF